MTSPSLWSRVKNAHLVRVLAIYLAAAWVVLQIVGLFIETMDLPKWTMPWTLALLFVGLVIVLVTAWIQSHPLMPQREAADEVPGDWEVDLGEIKKAVAKGRLPHLNWVRVILGGAIAFSLLFGITGLYVVIQDRGRSFRPSLEVSSSVIAILPFAIRGTGETAYLGDGMVNLLSTKLDGAGELRSVDPRALLSYTSQEADRVLDPTRAAEVARRFGAGFYVMGDVVEAGDLLSINASLYETDTAGAIAEASAEGPADEVFAMVDDIASRILANIHGDPGARIERIAAVTTSSLPALKEYLQGERAFRMGQYGQAMEAFQQAVSEDSLFALAYYRLGVAAEYLVRSDVASEAAEKALQHSDRLSEHDRRLLEASVANRRGTADKAEQMYRSLLSTYPDDVQAWFDLGETLFHLNPLRGRSPVEAREPFGRVLHYDPDHATAMIHLIRLHAAEREIAELDSLVAQFLSLAAGGDRGVEVRALQAFVHDDENQQREVVSDLRTAGEVPLGIAVWSVALFAGDLAETETVAKMLTEPNRSADVRAVGHIWLAHVQLAAGRWVAAKRELELAEDVAAPSLVLYYRVVLSLLPFVQVSDAELTDLLEAVSTLPSEARPTVGSVSTLFSGHRGVEPFVKSYLAGLLGSRLGRRDLTTESVDELERLGGILEVHTLGIDLAGAVQGHDAWLSGQTEAALERFEAMPMEGLYTLSISSELYSHVFARFLRAESLKAMGRDEDALRWYESLVWTSPYELVYRAPSHLGRAQIYDRAGDTERAAEQYARFVELWGDADPELQSLVEEARQAIIRLRGVRGE